MAGRQIRLPRLPPEKLNALRCVSLVPNVGNPPVIRTILNSTD